MNDDLTSEFDEDSEIIDKKKRRLDLALKVHETKPSVSDKKACDQEWNKIDRTQKYLSVDAYTRHKLLVNEYLLYHPGATKKLARDTTRDRTDLDVIRQNSKFLWSDVEEPTTWEAKLAKRYYDKLFKEYSISDLSRYKENKVALRWRTEQEVVEGKGQFICGEKKCREKIDLSSWEVNFSYVEEGVKKNALIKLRLCPECSYKLNYHHKKRKIIKPKRKSSGKGIKIESTSDAETSNETKTSANSSIKVEIEQISDEKEAELWQKPTEIDEEKSRDDEFEEFLEDLFL